MDSTPATPSFPLPTPTATPGALAHVQPSIVLSLDQKQAESAITTWYGERDTLPMFRLGGFAGTGKTTLIRHLLKSGNFGAIACCAFTGKAADVLTKKGVPASTIHSLIYNCDEDPHTKEIQFTLKTPEQLDLDLIIVDEASMISSDLYRDLKSFHIPLLFVGDPGQLEPVGDNPNLMRDPDFTLTQIHRQALESPIIRFASEIRTGTCFNPRNYKPSPPALNFQQKKFTVEQQSLADQFICAKNATRQLINQSFRRNLGHQLHDGLHDGEKLICLRNNRNLGFFNGQIFYVEKVKQETPRYFECVIRPDGSDKLMTIPIWSEPFYRELDPKTDHPPKDFVYADFGYCITCHKSQGSEWPHVVVVDEWMPAQVWDMKRWRYTAITRAATKLDFAM